MNPIRNKISLRFLLLLVILTSVLLNGCLQTFNDYGVVGTIVTNTDHTSVTVVVAENDAMTYQKNGGYRQTTYKTTYWLKQYETATGKLINKKKMFSPSEANRLSIACYGRHGNNIWMNIDGLIAFDINTLDEVTDEKKIAIKNGVKRTLFPMDDRLIRPHVEKGFINFISDDGEEYRLTLNDLSIQKKNSDEDETEAAEKQLNSLSDIDDYGVRCDTFHHTMFAFAKNEDAAKHMSPDHGDINETAYRMQLFSARYATQALGMHTSFSYSDIKPATGETFLNPCFAADTYKGTIIHLSNPDGYIIIHQDVLGEKSKAIITRIGLNGNIIWQKPSGVSTKIEACTLRGKYLLLSTNTAYMFSPFIGKDALCIIDTNNGNIIQPSLKD